MICQLGVYLSMFGYNHSSRGFFTQRFNMRIYVSFPVQARYGILLEESAKRLNSVGTSSKGVSSSESKRIVSSTVLTRSSAKETNESMKGSWKDLVLVNSGKGAVKEEQALRLSENNKCDTQEDDKDEPKDLLAAMDSFDNLFCRRCLV